jgi:hypothetical protein
MIKHIYVATVLVCTLSTRHGGYEPTLPGRYPFASMLIPGR